MQAKKSTAVGSRAARQKALKGSITPLQGFSLARISTVWAPHKERLQAPRQKFGDSSPPKTHHRLGPCLLHITLNYIKLCGSRKYPYPHHRGNWKFRRGGGGGGSKGQENPEERGGEQINYFPEGQLRFFPM